MRLTKLTTTSITAASPSIYTPIGNEPPCPRSIQFTENSMGAPPPGTIPATNNRAKTEKTSEMVTPSMATYWAFSLRRRPVRTSTRKTSAGSVGMAVMINCWPTVCTGSPLAPHRGYFVDVHGPPGAEHGEHDGETYRDLPRGYGDHDHGVADAQTPRVRQVVGEGYEGEIDGVDHKLHAHEDDDGVAPDQGPPGPDGEHKRPHNEITFQWRRSRQRFKKLLYLRRHYSSAPRSIPSAALRRLITMAPTIATSSNTETTSNSRVKTSAPGLTPSRSRPRSATWRGPLPASTPPQSSAEST